MALLVPAKLWRSLGRWRCSTACSRRATSCCRSRTGPTRHALFDAAVYPSLLVVRRGRFPTARRKSGDAGDGTRRACRRDVERRSSASSGSTTRPARRGCCFRHRRGARSTPFAAPVTPLGASPVRRAAARREMRVQRRVLVQVRDGTTIVSDNGTVVDVEPAMLRPLIRGEHVTRWRVNANGERVIWTQAPNGRAARSPSTARRALASRLAAAAARAIGRTREPRAGGRCFAPRPPQPNVARVVWADFGRALTAAVLRPGDSAVPLNTCYAVRCADRAMRSRSRAV